MFLAAKKNNYEIVNLLLPLAENRITNIAGGNVHDKGFVDVSSSSYANEDCHGKFACQLDELNYFHSQEKPNSYLQYDFKERRVHPTHYAIRCRHDYDGLILYQGMNSGSNPRD